MEIPLEARSPFAIYTKVVEIGRSSSKPLPRENLMAIESQANYRVSVRGQQLPGPGQILVFRGFSHDPSSGLAEVLALIMLTLLLRGGIVNARLLALESFGGGFSRRAFFLFRHTDKFPTGSARLRMPV